MIALSAPPENSGNVLYAVTVAKALGMKVTSMTNEQGGKLIQCADMTLNVLEKETYKVQERNLPIYHCICLAVEKSIFEYRCTKRGDF